MNLVKKSVKKRVKRMIKSRCGDTGLTGRQIALLILAICVAIVVLLILSGVNVFGVDVKNYLIERFKMR